MNTEGPERIVGLEELPDDPLKMPPPYWRSSGAIFQLVDAMGMINELLHTLVPIHAETEIRLHKHFAKYSEFYEKDDQCEDESVMQEFAEITSELNKHEFKVKLKTELACLMSAIGAEDNINCFCVYNLHRDIAESLEKLSISEKLLVASASITHKSAKSNVVFEAAVKLTKWRNAYVHGHCTDRPTSALRINHLIHPEDFPGVPSSIEDVRALVGAFLRIEGYLIKISVNPYTRGKSEQTENIRRLLKELSIYRFKGNNWVYNITTSKNR